MPVSRAISKKMKTILLIGLGKLGNYLAHQLSDLGHEVMAVDRDEENVKEVMGFVTATRIGDATNPQFLKSLGIQNYDVAYVTVAGDFQSSLEITSLLKEMGAPHVVARAERDIQEKFLLRNGADEVIYPEKQIAKWAAIRCSDEHILDYTEIDDRTGMFETTTPEAWIGKTVGELDVRKKYRLTILAHKTTGRFDFSVTCDTILTAGTTLLVCGEYAAVKKCFRF